MTPTYPIWDPRFKWDPNSNVLQRCRDHGFLPPGDLDQKEKTEAAIRAVRNYDSSDYSLRR